MRKSLICAVLLALSLVAAAPAFAAPKFKFPVGVQNICKKLVPLNNVLYKFVTSGGIGNSDPRNGSCTLVAGARQEGQFPQLNPLKIYDAKGKVVGQFNLYQNCPACAFSWRYYTANAGKSSHLCSAIVTKTHKDARNYKGFIALKSHKCYYIPDLRGRFGFAIP